MEALAFFGLAFGFLFLFAWVDVRIGATKA